MDHLQQQLFTALHAPTWTAGAGPAVDVALLGRFYKRFADYAVAMCRRLGFLVTGKTSMEPPRRPEPTGANHVGIRADSSAALEG